MIKKKTKKNQNKKTCLKKDHLLCSGPGTGGRAGQSHGASAPSARVYSPSSSYRHPSVSAVKPWQTATNRKWAGWLIRHLHFNSKLTFQDDSYRLYQWFFFFCFWLSGEGRHIKIPELFSPKEVCDESLQTAWFSSPQKDGWITFISYAEKVNLVYINCSACLMTVFHPQ